MPDKWKAIAIEEWIQGGPYVPIHANGETVAFVRRTGDSKEALALAERIAAFVNEGKSDA